MAKILCIEDNAAVRESRCAVMNYSGYDATSASLQLAEIVLRGRKFDLIVVSSLHDHELHKIVNFIQRRGDACPRRAGWALRTALVGGTGSEPIPRYHSA